MTVHLWLEVITENHLAVRVGFGCDDVDIPVSYTHLVNGHNLLLLITTVTTGRTIRRLVECAKYYGGNIIGVAAIFSSIDEIDGIPVQHLFSAADLPDFAVFSHSECPACRDKVPIDGLANSFGISRVN